MCSYNGYKWSKLAEILIKSNFDYSEKIRHSFKIIWSKKSTKCMAKKKKKKIFNYTYFILHRLFKRCEYFLKEHVFI